MEIQALLKCGRPLLRGLCVCLAVGLMVGCQTTEPATDVAVVDESDVSVPAVEEATAEEADAPNTPGDSTEPSLDGAAEEREDVEGDAGAEASTEEMAESEPVEAQPAESAASAPEEEEIIDDPSIGASLTVLGVPRSARVRIMNIKEKYRRGMRLPPGIYEVVVDEPGYVPKTRTVKLGPKDIRMEVKLSREP